MGKRLTKAAEAQARANAAPLFAHWQETLVWTSLAGDMGSVWTLSAASALCECGDFVFAEAAHGEEHALLAALNEHLNGRFCIFASHSERLMTLVPEMFRAQRETRYAFEKNADHLQRAPLEMLAAQTPQDIEFRLMDEAICQLALAEEWSRDLCSQFASPKHFAERGMGVAALHEGMLVGGAASYVCYPGGIEIELDTREGWRGRGVATACAARLVLACLDRGLYPSWDAANMTSVRIAQRLGYRLSHPYPVWHLNP